MTDYDQKEAAESLDRYEALSMYCIHPDIENKIIITKDPRSLIILE